jgi:hypothetical protein
MDNIARLPGADLLSRRDVTVAMPEFLLRAFEYRLAEVNAGAAEHERVELEDLIELELADSLTLADIAHLEGQVPGIAAAVSQWLAEIT